MSNWTIEETAEYLGLKVQDIYESRRSNTFPGTAGRRVGRRLLFDAEKVKAGPQEPETTNDPATAILWALSGIHETLRAIHTELRKANHTEVTVTTGEDDDG